MISTHLSVALSLLVLTVCPGVTIAQNAEFTKRANDLYQTAVRLSSKQDGGEFTAINRCLRQAKSRRMSWVEGLEYAVQVLQ